MRNPLFLLIISVLFVSCTDTLDFSQVKDYNATRVYDFTILYFSANQSRFKDASGADLDTPVSDETRFTLFDDHVYVKKKFVKAELAIEITNEFNRSFKIEMLFLNEKEEILYKAEDIVVNSNTLSMMFKEEISTAKTPGIVNTRKIRTQITMLPSSTPLNFSEPKEITVKSVGKFYLKS